MRLRSRGFALAVVVIGGGVAGGVFGSVHLAEGASTPPTTVGPSANGGPLESSAAEPTASAATVGSVVASMPAGFAVQNSAWVKDTTRSYEDVAGALPNGNTDEITVYEVFAPKELDGAGYSRVSIDGGTAWIGRDYANMRVIYFLSSNGVGIRMAETASSGTAASVDGLAAIAQSIASKSRPSAVTP